MLNLLGCNKDNFLKLIKKMNYEVSEKNNEHYFKYNPTKKSSKKFNKKSEAINNPFEILKGINFN